MSLDLDPRLIYSPSLNGIGTSWQKPILKAAAQAVDTYEQIDVIDAAREKPVMTRHLGVIAVLDREKSKAWNDRIRGIVLFGSLEGLNEDENLELMVAKALHRAVLAEDRPSIPPIDATPAYLGLGRAHKAFSSGIAGPYPFHSRLTHDTFHHSMEKLYFGLMPFPDTHGEEARARIAEGFIGGLRGDSGDNTDELERARQPFMDFAESMPGIDQIT